MLIGHVRGALTAYMDGELEPSTSSRVAEHLLVCERCRAEYDDVRFAAGLAGRLRAVAPPDDLWDAIEMGLHARPAAATIAVRPRVRWLPYAAAVTFAAVSLCVAVALHFARAEAAPTWAVSSTAGVPTIDACRVGADARMGVGESLVTDGASCAQISVGAIGTVDVEPNSCVRLLDVSMSEHRLALDRGTLHARILAPPRLFFVDTPSGVAVDYGCAYTLSVDDAGASLLHVTSGWVALEHDGRDALVPAGALCRTEPGRGPGTPYFDDAPEPLRASLATYDADSGDAAALAAVLGSARPRDSLTLWYLLARAGPDDRPAVYDRLAALAPPPDGVTRARALALDRDALDRWRSSLERAW